MFKHFVLCCLTLLMFFIAPLSNALESERKPNIIFIMVDDMGYADAGCFGGTAVKTPNLDKLAAEGMKFTQFYSGCTVCAPARSTLMTGHHMGNTSVRLNTGGAPLLDADITVAEVLKKAGYRTGGFGKWGVGDIGTPGVPEKQGFDDFFGYYHQIHAHYFYTDYLLHNSKEVNLDGNKNYYKQKRNNKHLGTSQNQYTHTIIFDEMKKWIRANKDQPFFCYAPWTPPHGRYEFPADDPAWKMYKDKPWGKNAKVAAAMISMIDRHVGETIALLKELNLDDNTLVMFCSDHGAAERFDNQLNSSGPLRGRKRAMYEGGLRTPFIARWPGKIKPDTTSQFAGYFPDIMPTLADVANATPPSNIDGISFLPTLLGKKQQRTHDYLYWEWHLYNWGKKHNEPNGLMQAIRMGDWKILRHRSDQSWELYNLSKDIGEKNNLAAKHPDRVKSMVSKIKQIRTEPRPQSEPSSKGRRPFH